MYNIYIIYICINYFILLYYINSIVRVGLKNVSVVLVGNKTDKEEKRKVSRDEGEKFAEELNISFFECSAKKDINVEITFETFFNQICNKVMKDEIKYEDNIKIVYQEKEKEKKKNVVIFKYISSCYLNL